MRGAKSETLRVRGSGAEKLTKLIRTCISLELKPKTKEKSVPKDEKEGRGKYKVRGVTCKCKDDGRKDE